MWYYLQSSLSRALTRSSSFATIFLPCLKAVVSTSSRRLCSSKDWEESIFRFLSDAIPCSCSVLNSSARRPEKIFVIDSIKTLYWQYKTYCQNILSFFLRIEAGLSFYLIDVKAQYVENRIKCNYRRHPKGHHSIKLHTLSSENDFFQYLLFIIGKSCSTIKITFWDYLTLDWFTSAWGRGMNFHPVLVF